MQETKLQIVQITADILQALLTSVTSMKVRKDADSSSMGSLFASYSVSEKLKKLHFLKFSGGCLSKFAPDTMDLSGRGS